MSGLKAKQSAEEACCRYDRNAVSLFVVLVVVVAIVIDVETAADERSPFEDFRKERAYTPRAYSLVMVAVMFPLMAGAEGCA